MAIEKFIAIRNVGRFTKLAAKDDVLLRKVTMIYGDNGSGKTTLAGVLRSLATGNPSFIDERGSLGSDQEAHVKILLDDGMATYAQRRWDRRLDDIEIFDSTFVSDNVYTGDRVEIEHRKNLYEVVVGAAAVALARQVDELNSEGKKTARKINKTESELKNRIQSPFQVDDFIALVPETELAQKIADATTRLNAARQSAKLVSRRELQLFSEPASPRDLVGVLESSVESISRAAEQRVREHIREHLDDEGERWLRKGLGYVKDDNCPFCGQSLEDRELVGLYGDFFSNKYKEHVIAIRQAQHSLQQRLSEEALANLQKVATDNVSRIEAWKDLKDLSHAAASLDVLASAWRAVKRLLESALERKLADPGTQVSGMEEIEAALRDYENAVAELKSFNSEISIANAEIAELKRQSAAANQAELEAELRRLRNMQLRTEPEIDDLCGDLVRAREEKHGYEEDKRVARERLEQQATSLLAEYESDINQLLQGFGASFRITGTKPDFAAGGASSTYQLEIDGIALPLGDSRTPRGTPCFRTALSAGDKSTLALAFFLARLKRDPQLSVKTVVFDDPLSSLDTFRTTFTQQELARIATTATQTLILSHDPFFLHGVAQDERVPTVKALRIARKGDTHTLSPWSLEDECMPQAHKDYFLLCRFMEDGLSDGTDLVMVARSIRPYVEGYLRIKYPDRFPSGIMLGTFIKAVREADSGNELAKLRSRLGDLEDLNAFARRFPHDNPGRTTEPEVRAYVEKAFAFVRD